MSGVIAVKSANRKSFLNIQVFSVKNILILLSLTGNIESINLSITSEKKHFKDLIEIKYIGVNKNVTFTSFAATELLNFKLDADR